MQTSIAGSGLQILENARRRGTTGGERTVGGGGASSRSASSSSDRDCGASSAGLNGLRLRTYVRSMASAPPSAKGESSWLGRRSRFLSMARLSANVMRRRGLALNAPPSAYRLARVLAGALALVLLALGAEGVAVRNAGK
jgi:hypothetical protein